MADEKKEPPKKRPENDDAEKDSSKKPRRRKDKPVEAEPTGPGDPVNIHEDYVRRHLGDGAPATPEAYERAIEQWRKLPGSVVSEPPGLRPVTEHPEDEEAPDDPEDEYGQEEPPDDPTNELGEEGKPS